MGTGLGPAWFSPEFPSLAARRDPFPDVDRWQTTYVRYSSSETAQARGWDMECCRRNLSSLGVNDHPILRHKVLPDTINMRIIEAPAEFALPVKQDRRLLPCFKVRLEVQHRGAVSLPVTLRAHVLSQQDKDQINSWLPPDDAAGRGDKGQKPVTELKGTSLIRCTLEAGSSSEARTVSLGGMDAQGLPQSNNGGSVSMAYNNAMRGADRLVKPEPSNSFSGVSNGAVSGSLAALGPGGFANCGIARNLSGLQDDQHTRQPYGVMESSGLTVNGVLRDMSVAGFNGLTVRDVSLSNLFAANRPDPVVTLASSGRMSATGSSISGLGAGMRLSPGDPGDTFDATVEMLMQQPLQQPPQRQPSPLLSALETGVSASGAPLLNGMQRQLLQRQEEQGQRSQQHDRSGTNGSVVGNAVLQGGKLITATQDFEFTNLEFLKPTRMNKVYMAFSVSILDTDLLFVVFNVPTIGICRAEQREKACKKLHIDYRLLSHFDQGGCDRLDIAAPTVPSGGGGGMYASNGGRGPSQESNPQPAQERYVEPSRSEQERAAAQQQQQQQQQEQQHGGQQQESKYTQAMSPILSMLSGTTSGSIRFSKQQDSGRLPGHLSDIDFPRMSPGLGLQQAQQQPPQQPRLAEGCGGVGMCGAARLQAGGLGCGGSGLLGGAGGMAGGALPRHALVSGGITPGMNLSAMTDGGIVGAGSGMLSGGMAGGGGLGSRIMSGEISFGLGPNSTGCGLEPPSGSDFFFCSGALNGNTLGLGLNCGLNGSMGVTGGGGCGLSLSDATGMGGGAAGLDLPAMEQRALGIGGNSRKRDQGLKDDDNYRFQPVPPQELPPYQGFMGLTSSDVEMLLPAPHSRMAMRDFINEVYDGTGLHRKLTHMDMQALLSQAGFPMDSNREHDTISPQQWDEFCSQFRSIVNTLQQVASVWNMEDPVVISGFDMDRAGTIAALANEPAGTFICRFSMSQPGCLVLTCKVGTVHPRADPMGLIHAIIKIDDLHERRVDTWIRDYAGATHLLDVYRQKRVDKRKVFATNYTRLRGLEVGGEQLPFPLGLGPGYM
ncbi:hypothetical protein Vretimale_3493 [Volvox reticuliferus]|uniref:SH2 domain-containing protein n=1 Tax=Volvox reticuliferus TaxID=1737510 RepID=A0A8J4D8N8_9CHLO|nr:hypothetical protein Vretifemale_1048 [Volvox reticuliferus]GIL97927.1 hypothetical protein Vretimale_3493 [Volvox reticuliferus]